MSEQADLIAKLSEATAGSEDLDRAVSLACGIRLLDGKGRLYYVDDEGARVYGGLGDYVITPPVTTSVDAALALIEKRLPGWYWGAGPGTATLLDEKMPGMFRVDARGATAPLALCIALLRSLQAQQTAALKPEGGET